MHVCALKMKARCLTSFRLFLNETIFVVYRSIYIFIHLEKIVLRYLDILEN